MGTDVFGVFEKRENGRWEYITDFYDGQRGHLRAWLGWSDGRLWSEPQSGDDFRTFPIAPSRGLPNDFDYSEGIYRVDATRYTTVGRLDCSWLQADEILNALPILGIRSLTVPIGVYEKAWEHESDIARWQEITGLCQETWLPKLVGVSSCPEGFLHGTRGIPVKCLYDFSEDEDLSYFTDEVRQLRDFHGEVRFVYGFG
jgi:hypothetical protein